MGAYAWAAALLSALSFYLHVWPCDAKEPGRLVKLGEPISIGIATVLSGQEAFLGREILDGAEAFVKDRQTVFDHPIRLVPLDDGCDPAACAERAKEFCGMEPRPMAVVGYICSAGAMKAAEIHAQCGLPLLNVSSPNPLLTAGGSGWVFRLWASHGKQGALFADWVQSKSFRHTLILHEKDPASLAIATGAKENISKMLPRFQASSISTDEAIPGPGKLAQARESFQLVFYVGEGWNLKDLWKRLPRTILNTPWLLDARAVALLSLAVDAPRPKEIYSFSFPPPSGDPRRPDFLYFRGRFGEPGFYTLAAYDAMAVLAEALQRSGRRVGDAILWETEALLRALRETQLHGLTGPISFDQRGDRRESRAQIRQWKGGCWEVVWESRTQ